MIADHYLQLRGEVEAVLGDLLKFAAELRRPGPELDGLHGLLTNIREPLLFVVVGEVKAGKSSLINALFGQEIAKADVLPATDLGAANKAHGKTCAKQASFLFSAGLLATVPGISRMIEVPLTLIFAFM